MSRSKSATRIHSKNKSEITIPILRQPRLKPVLAPGDARSYKNEEIRQAR